MGQILLNKAAIRNNKSLRNIQKISLYKSKKLIYKDVNLKIGKVFRNTLEEGLDCSGAEESRTVFDVERMTETEMLQILRDKQVNGQNGSVYPTADKIETVMRAPASMKYFIINAVACDPGLLQDEWLLANKRNQIEKGIGIISQFIDFSKVVVASRDNVPNKYPMGAENILIHYLLDIEIPEGKKPSDIGILVLNLQTVYAVYEAFYCNKTFKTKYITVGDLDTGEALVARIRIGQQINEILRAAEAEKESIYMGCGIMDAQKVSMGDVAGEEVNLIAVGNAVTMPEEKCKHCGGCTKKCPMNIKVDKIVKALEKNDIQEAATFHPEKCIGCRACSYGCKAGKDVKNLMKQLNEDLKESK